MTTLKEGNTKWDEQEIIYTCKICGCQFKGTVKDGDFTIITDNPKQYNYKCNCPTCGNEIKF